MSNKDKGSRVERELLQIFTKNGWRAARVAGSGLNDDSPCDLIAGNAGMKFAVECKSSREKKRYLDKAQINDFLVFSEIFGLEPILAMRFNREGWFFLNLKEIRLDDTGSCYGVSLDFSRRMGKRFGEIFSRRNEEEFSDLTGEGCQ